MNLLTMFLRRSRSGLCVATLGGMVSGLSTTALIVMVNHMIRWHDRRTPIVIFGFTCLCVLRLLTGIVSHALLIRLSQDAVHDLRLELCTRIINAPLRQVEQIGAGKFTSAFADDILLVGTAVINLPYFFVNGIVLCGCLVYLGWLAWQLLVGIVAAIAIGAVSYAIVVSRANSLLRSAREEQGQLFRHFGQLIAGVKELKLHAGRRRDFMTKLLGTSADRVRRDNTAGITLYSVAANWGRLLFFVYAGLILLWPASRPDSVELAASIIVILYMMAPLEAILNSLPVMAQANVALAKVGSLQSLLGVEAVSSLATSVAERADHWHALALIDVCYRYEAAEESRSFALGPINLVLRPGEITFLVGGNGSGKTTLGKVIAGLYHPDSGEIRVDDDGLGTSGHPRIRAMFAAVFSDFCLFDRVLGIDPNRLQNFGNQYLHSLKLDHKVRIEGGQFTTMDLSQGQRKRLALVAALLEDRSIYLFDEWAADQDPEFKEVFYNQIVPDLIHRGKAVVVITHDDRYFHIADQLVCLDEGKITALPSTIGNADRLAFSKGNGARQHFDATAV